MKESKLYLNFFRQNILFIFFFGVIFLAIGLIFISQKESLYTLSALYQLNIDEDKDIQNKVMVADEIVSSLRSNNVQHKLNLDDLKVVIFKPGPLQIKVELTDVSVEKLDLNFKKIDEYISLNYDVQGLGDVVVVKNDLNLLLYSVVFTSLGLFAGLLVSLIREYLKKY